jgi:putative transposase
MAKAYATGAFTMKEIGDFFGVHYMTVSRALRTFEADPRSESRRRP